MGRIIVKKVKGMSWTAKISLMLIFRAFALPGLSRITRNMGSVPRFPLTILSILILLFSVWGISEAANQTTVSEVATITAKDYINIRAAYTGDDNTDNTLKVEYKPSSEPTTWTLHANLSHSASPYTTQITGLTEGTEYDVRVTYNDTDGVVGTNPVIIYKVVPSKLMHTSYNLGSSKWGGKWGTYESGSKYGEFTCGVCHKPRTTNIKGVTSPIVAPADTFLGSTVNFQSTTTPNGFGDDSDAPRVISTRICEVCHTYDATQTSGVNKHAYNQAVNSNHYNATDCIDCHKHNAAFSGAGGACDGCHGAPPTAGGLAAHAKHYEIADVPTAYGDATFRSTTTLYGFSCGKCHLSGPHMDGSVDGSTDDISFDDTTNPKNPGGTYTFATKTCSNLYCHGNFTGGKTAATPVWTGTVNCGDCHGINAGDPPGTVASGSSSSHAAHITGSTLNLGCGKCHNTYTNNDTHVNGSADWYLDSTDNRIGSGTYKGAASGTNTPPGSAAYGQCSNIPCHSSGQNATGGLPPTYGTPTWGGALNCGSCHKNMDTDAAATGNHTKHAQGGYNIACATCHNGYTETTVAGATHANNLITLSFSGIAPATTYSQGLSHALGNGYGTCSTAYCHSNVQGAGGSGAPSTYATPTWGGAALTCLSCHKNMDTDAAATGSHTKHAQASAIACATCHNGYTETTVDSATHVNNSINLSFTGSGTGTTYSQGVASAPGNGYGTCSTNTCHGTSTPTWGAATSTGCNFCHPYSAGEWSGYTPIAVEGGGAHAKHITHIAFRFSVTLAPSTDSFGTGNAAKVCGTCHTNTVGNHISGSRLINFGDATYKEGGSTGFSFLFGPTNPVYNGIVGNSSSVNLKSCSAVGCHFKTTPAWNAY